MFIFRWKMSSTYYKTAISAITGLQEENDGYVELLNTKTRENNTLQTKIQKHRVTIQEQNKQIQQNEQTERQNEQIQQQNEEIQELREPLMSYSITDTTKRHAGRRYNNIEHGRLTGQDRTDRVHNDVFAKPQLLITTAATGAVWRTLS
jgi:chromosome segregation ATPase